MYLIKCFSNEKLLWQAEFLRRALKIPDPWLINQALSRYSVKEPCRIHESVDLKIGKIILDYLADPV